MKTLRVVIADDDLIFIKSLEAILGTIPQVIIVGSARNGIEAIKEVRRVQPDLVLLDIMMPEMDGIDATKYIKQLTNPPRIIMISAHKHYDSYLAAKASGADAVIWKPIHSRRHLRDVIFQIDSTFDSETESGEINHLSP